MKNPNLGAIARPGWEFRGGFKPLIYAKTATALKTMERIVGREVMDEMIQTYFKVHKFTHPKESDIRNVFREVLAKHGSDFDVDRYFDQVLHTTHSIDFELVDIDVLNATIQAERIGDLEIDTEVLVTFSDGSTKTIDWRGSQRELSYTFEVESEIVSAHIDPQQKIYLDLNLNNNSLTFNSNKKPMYKYAAKIGHWFQVVSQWTTFMM